MLCSSTNASPLLFLPQMVQAIQVLRFHLLELEKVSISHVYRSWWCGGGGPSAEGLRMFVLWKGVKGPPPDTSVTLVIPCDLSHYDIKLSSLSNVIRVHIYIHTVMHM